MTLDERRHGDYSPGNVQPEAIRFVSELTHSTVALVLAGGRGTRLKQLTDWRCKAGGAVRRQVPHHRFHAVELREFRHSPHRRRHAVQGAQPDPPHPARLEFPRRPLRGVHRTAAGAAAGCGSTGTAARPTPSSRTCPCCTGIRRSTCWSSPATTSTRWTMAECSRTTWRARRDLTVGVHRGAARGRRRFRRDGRRCEWARA